MCSVVERLSGFERALERVRIQAATGGGVQRNDGDPTHLTVEGVDPYLPEGRPPIAHMNLSLLRGDTVPEGFGFGGRVRSSVRSREFGRLGTARSAGRMTAEFSFCRRSRTCRSARCGKWCVTRCQQSAWTTRHWARRWRQWGYLNWPSGLTRPAIGRFNFPLANSNASPLLARSFRSPIGSSSMRRPRRWMRLRRGRLYPRAAGGGDVYRCGSRFVRWIGRGRTVLGFSCFGRSGGRNERLGFLEGVADVKGGEKGRGRME